MDRRSWLWRRKSSDKSNGETGSSGSGSGSIASPSERFSYDQQVYANQIVQSTEVSSKAVVQDEDVNDRLKVLTDKLHDALAKVSANEELVQQHAKVAEEAVTGWEKAEKEVTTLKLQLDDATKKHSSLEDTIVHLDGALKESLRQLRQVKEEQDMKIQEAIAKKSQDSESKSFNDLHLRLESAEKENASLELKLRSLSEELEIRTFERDLNAKTAETVSKHHLDSMKKVANLEAECRKLKSLARKTPPFNDKPSFEKSPTISPMTPSDDIGFMDDFIEMEKLAALSVRENTKTELEKKIETLKAQKEESQSQLSVVQAESKSLLDKCKRLEEELSRIKLKADNSKAEAERELEMKNAMKDSAELLLRAAEAKTTSLLAKVGSLEHELSNMKCGIEFRVASKSKEELDIQQEKELYVATAKLVECQKTIASLGKQLKSLPIFDDLFVDSGKVIEVGL